MIFQRLAGRCNFVPHFAIKFDNLPRRIVAIEDDFLAFLVESFPHPVFVARSRLFENISPPGSANDLASVAHVLGPH